MVTDPVLGPLRRYVPPLRLGAVALDLSSIIVIFGITILRSAICS
ncbi:MAG: YggT family protein [Acidimicrobiales bacterium]